MGTSGSLWSREPVEFQSQPYVSHGEIGAHGVQEHGGWSSTT